MQARPVILAILAAPLLLLLAQTAQAQADPTRPPSQRSAADDAAQGGQVVVSGAKRRFVLVDGHAVHPGETWNGAKLLSVGPEGAVWQRGDTRESVNMSPNVQKTVLPAASAPRRRASASQ
jgi:hypothetical protein